ncbi:class I SAM-dependent methyltransferase [Bacillus sp. 3255]|uniref:class I SAM-dependent methyltransferase n=1 Tax=Bacillus sp. 3255 TaxID=2817904 RepID=UPI00285BFFAF|nr:class I SAM-dependent methyltransferase [Bacillus sp. 3255]MDR6881566.1 ubiquinone/menaquinone biosynthesis C-methylase UbiE [Bacillus sp. 3255]
MPDHEHIYHSQAETYDLLISKQPSLYSVIDAIKPAAGLDILDLGAGSGRLTCALAPQAKSILALDESQAMLDLTAHKLRAAGLRNWSTRVADHRALPVEDRSVDLVVSGWSICYLGSSTLPNWQADIRQVMAEIKRVLRPGGCAIIIENYGTASETPDPPAFLLDYFAQLEKEYGFSSTWVRTDYGFDSLQEAERLTRFFFGDAIADRVVREGWTRVPECAGVWWLRV